MLSLVCAALLNHADAFAIPVPPQPRIPTTTHLTALANPYLQSLSKTHPRARVSKIETTSDYLNSLSTSTVDAADENLTSTYCSTAKENKRMKYSSIGTNTETLNSSVCFRSTTENRSNVFTFSAPPTHIATVTKMFGSDEYLNRLQEIGNVENVSREQRGVRSLHYSTATLYDARKSDTMSTPARSLSVAKKSNTQDYLSSLARFDDEIKAETKKTAAYLDCTTAALYSAANIWDVYTQSTTDAASHTFLNRDTSQEVGINIENDVTVTSFSSKLFDEAGYSIPSTLSTMAVTYRTHTLSEEGSFLLEDIVLCQKDESLVFDSNFATNGDFPKVYATITEDMARRIAMAADFVMEKHPLETLSHIANELSVGELSDRATRCLLNLGEAFVMALGIVLHGVSGKNFNDLVEGAQKAARNAITTSVASLSVAVQEVGQMEVSEVLQSMITLVVTISSALFRMLNAVVEIVAGKSINDIAGAVSQSIEAQISEMLATVDGLSDKSLHELNCMLVEFESQAIDVVLKTCTATMVSMGANLEVLSGLKMKALELKNTNKSTSVQGV